MWWPIWLPKWFLRRCWLLYFAICFSRLFSASCFLMHCGRSLVPFRHLLVPFWARVGSTGRPLASILACSGYCLGSLGSILLDLGSLGFHFGRFWFHYGDLACRCSSKAHFLHPQIIANSFLGEILLHFNFFLHDA